MFHDDGTSTEFIAPAFYIGKPGRKIGYVHEDMVWQNIYPTDETDVETLEETYLTKSDEWVDDNNIRGKALELSCASDNDDYNKMLSETGYTEDIVRAQSENTDDIIKLPFSGYKIMVSDSPIEGKGLFATSDIDEDEVIAPARINGNRTIAGRYTNHAKFPNAEMVLLPDGDFNLVSINSIKGCLGGQKGDEITIDYRQALELKVQSCQA